MKNRICEVYSLCEVSTTEAEKLYIIDFTERTMSVRKVEIHTKNPFYSRNYDRNGWSDIE